MVFVSVFSLWVFSGMLLRWMTITENGQKFCNLLSLYTVCIKTLTSSRFQTVWNRFQSRYREVKWKACAIKVLLEPLCIFLLIKKKNYCICKASLLVNHGCASRHTLFLKDKHKNVSCLYVLSEILISTINLASKDTNAIFHKVQNWKIIASTLNGNTCNTTVV